MNLDSLYSALLDSGLPIVTLQIDNGIQPIYSRELTENEKNIESNIFNVQQEKFNLSQQIVLAQKELADIDLKRSRPLADIALGNGNIKTGADNKTALERLLDIEEERVLVSERFLNLQQLINGFD